jgi:hypothetical protein
MNFLSPNEFFLSNFVNQVLRTKEIEQLRKEKCLKERKKIPAATRYKPAGQDFFN